MIQVGSKLEDYEVVARLRSGGMAALYLGRRVGAAGFSRPVAIKVIHPHLSEDKNFVTMFVDEAKLSARISHPNVVHVEELGQKGNTYYLVMEYVHGCSLSQLIRALRARNRRFTPEMATYIAINMAEGLHAAHETMGDDGQSLGVVHRDVSPQNILLSYRGHTKLIDFGVAKARGRGQHTTVASLKGKLRYMAPEQASSLAVDRRTDVYALAIVLWEMLTMRPLFKADNDLKLHDLVKSPVVTPPNEVVEGIPQALSDAVMKGLARNPEDRPTSAQDFRRMLVQAVPGALAIDSEQLSDLLRAVMGDVIRDQHRRFPESVGNMLRREVGDVLDRPPGSTDDEDMEILQTLTTTESNLEGTDGGGVDSRGSQASVASPGMQGPAPEAMPVEPTASDAAAMARGAEAPEGAAWVRPLAVLALALMVGVAVYFFAQGLRNDGRPAAAPPPVAATAPVPPETGNAVGSGGTTNDGSNVVSTPAADAGTQAAAATGAGDAGTTPKRPKGIKAEVRPRAGDQELPPPDVDGKKKIDKDNDLPPPNSDDDLPPPNSDGQSTTSGTPAARRRPPKAADEPKAPAAGSGTDLF